MHSDCQRLWEIRRLPLTLNVQEITSLAWMDGWDLGAELSTSNII